MKKFLEVRIPLREDSSPTDQIIARLSEIGFDGFIEEDDTIITYIEQAELTHEAMQAILLENGILGALISEIDDRNWNAEWESDYEYVVIDDSIMVRAPFHAPKPGIEWDIVIEPKMSFGTAHHETTSQVLSILAGMDLEGSSVLDMGCGTAVLAILARKKGASPVTAIDNDEWAYNNSVENTLLNATADIEVILGDASDIENRSFDIIFANINRNILLRDIPRYSQSLNAGGSLVMSGFYLSDLDQIREKSESAGLRLLDSRSKNKWTAAVFIKDTVDD